MEVIPRKSFYMGYLHRFLKAIRDRRQDFFTIIFIKKSHQDFSFFTRKVFIQYDSSIFITTRNRMQHNYFPKGV
jgi:hypothetical protein